MEVSGDRLRENHYLCTQKYISSMAQVEYITIKNASRKVLNKMREIGEKKALRLQEIQERWDAGDIKDVEVVQL